MNERSNAIFFSSIGKTRFHFTSMICRVCFFYRVLRVALFFAICKRNEKKKETNGVERKSPRNPWHRAERISGIFFFFSCAVACGAAGRPFCLSSTPLVFSSRNLDSFFIFGAAFVFCFVLFGAEWKQSMHRRRFLISHATKLRRNWCLSPAAVAAITVDCVCI